MSFKYPQFIAHRGASAVAPENTLLAFREAKRLGAEMVEFDMGLSKDDVPVIIHDDSVDRTTNGSGVVRALDWVKLSQLDAGRGEGIPTLQQALSCLAKLQLVANIEIKPCSDIEKKTVAQVLKVLSHWQGKLPAVVVSSFSREVLCEVRALDSKILLAALFDRLPDDWAKQIFDLNCLSINLNQVYVTEEQISVVKSLGFQVLCYTVDKLSNAERLFDMGVDSVFVNAW